MVHYAMNVMGYGYKQAINVFQNIMDNVLQNIPEAELELDLSTFTGELPINTEIESLCR